MGKNGHYEALIMPSIRSSLLDYKEVIIGIIMVTVYKRFTRIIERNRAQCRHPPVETESKNKIGH